MFIISGKYTKAMVLLDAIEETCVSQITRLVNHPAFTNPIVIMPDAHAGKVSCIGFTMPMSKAVIPAVVGVDIGCGMLALNIGKNLNWTLSKLDTLIRAKVPFGSNVHEESILHMKNDFPWRRATTTAQNFSTAYYNTFGKSLPVPRYDMEWFLAKCENLHDFSVRRGISSIGTLGGGNHFIEIGIDVGGNYWLTIHTGSRQFGERIAKLWQGRAVKYWREDLRKAEEKRIKATETDGKVIYDKIKALKREMKLGVDIDMKGCEWLEGDLATGYFFDMIFAQTYAEVNREYIGRIICDILKVEPFDRIETVHNFIDFRDWIIRKGAVRSYQGERFVLPFNMRDGILLCEGKSNPDWNFSAPHGAGRVLARGEAKRKLSLDKFKEQMIGIYSTSVVYDTLDESPDAYKDCKVIEVAIEPTATVINRIKPILNMKDAKPGG